ncbi:MAG: cupin domain-containing protein [Acidimicrobiales bacterium]
MVTGRSPTGASVVVSDGSAPRSHAYEHIPGLVETLVWATGADVEPSEGDGTDPTAVARSYVPPRGGTRLIWLEIPPDTAAAGTGFDPAAARAEQLAASPGLAQRFEEGAPGMHTTPTVDYAVLVRGELWLELDDGHETRLRPGDVVVQDGTRHAWRNHGDSPATLAVVLVGTDR